MDSAQPRQGTELSPCKVPLPQAAKAARVPVFPPEEVRTFKARLGLGCVVSNPETVRRMVVALSSDELPVQLVGV